MGYYTHYSLTAHTNFDGVLYNSFNIPLETEKEVMKKLCEVSMIWDETQVDEWDDPFDMISDDTYKWYDYESDMLNLSRMFPNLWFVLEGHGEEWDDIWRSLYHNGEYEFQCIDMQFPDFNRKRWRD